MAYRIVEIPITLSDLWGDGHNAGLLKCDFCTSAADKISTDIVRRAVAQSASCQNYFTRRLGGNLQ